MDSAALSLRPRPRVAFVGGVERLERELVLLGHQLGVDVDVHDGNARGHGGKRLAALVSRMDVVVLVTGVISHGAVHLAKRAAEEHGARVVILKFCGTSTARALLTEIAHALPR